MGEYGFVFLAGLLGSAHCVGMCGVFVLGIARTAGTQSIWIRQSVYFIGKTITYTILGGIVGLLGTSLSFAFQTGQILLSVVVGVFMIIIGLGLLGLIKPIENFGNLAQTKVYKKGFGHFFKKKGYVGALGLGLLNGLLPCGLVMAMLGNALAKGTLWGAMMTMFVFGIATIPALFILGLMGHLLKPLWRKRLNQIGALVVIVLGILTIIRPFMRHEHTHQMPPDEPASMESMEPHSH